MMNDFTHTFRCQPGAQRATGTTQRDGGDMTERKTQQETFLNVIFTQRSKKKKKSHPVLLLNFDKITKETVEPIASHLTLALTLT